MIIDQLAELQVRRTGYIRAVNRIDNAAAALARRHLGWRYDTPEAERSKVNARAKAIASTFYAGKEQKEADAAVAATLAPDLENYRQAREPFVKARVEIEKAMRKLAHQLPAWKWAETVRGFGDLAFAVIVAEIGEDLAGYKRRDSDGGRGPVDRIWKRFGLTPHAGHAASTWRRKGGLDAEEWSAFGYAPKRNAESYAVLGDPLFRQQSVIAGPYRAVYDREKARFLAGGKPKGHAHNHGLRCMRKAALEDLWRAWNGRLPKERGDGGQGEITDGHSSNTPAPTA